MKLVYKEVINATEMFLRARLPEDQKMKSHSIAGRSKPPLIAVYMVNFTPFPASSSQCDGMTNLKLHSGSFRTHRESK
jgi:hypothetical protein